MAEKGDILSLTMLSKRVSIKSNSDVTKMEAPIPHKKVESMPYRKSKTLFSSDTPAFRVSMDENGFYCFEPTTLVTLSIMALLIQGIMLSAVLIMAIRLKGYKRTPYL